MKTYEDILSPFFIETSNAQDKATTAARNEKTGDLRMILSQIAAHGAVRHGPIGKMNERTANKFKIQSGLMVNTDFT